jgi:16S rRNA (uracil1498-N3)-methyltransferase
MPFVEAIREVGAAGVVLHNGEGLPALEGALTGSGSVGLFVGPEGGWSAGELRAAEEAGARLASLGPFRLRSETAGIVAVARAAAQVEARERKVEEALEGSGRAG